MAAILYQNILREDGVLEILTDESVGSNIADATDGRTTSSASFASGATRSVVVDWKSNKVIDSIAIARHNFGTAGATITVAGSSDNVTYNTLMTLSPTDDKVYFKKVLGASYRYWRIQVSGHTITVHAADISLGDALTLERDQKHGFIAPEFADGDEVVANVTRGQQLAGLTVKTGLKRCRLTFNYYTRSSFFVFWPYLVDAIKQWPAYILWDAADSEQPFYGWPTKKMPEPRFSKNIGGYEYLDASLDLQGFTE